MAPATGQALLNLGFVSPANLARKHSVHLHLKSPDSAQVARVLQSPFAHFTKGVWKFFPRGEPTAACFREKEADVLSAAQNTTDGS